MRASLCALSILVATLQVEAQPAGSIASAQQKLESSDPAQVSEALAELAAIGGDAAALAVANRLKRGLPPQLTEAAVEALRGLARPNAAPVLLELRYHRRPAVRAGALAALGELKQRSAQPALQAGLDDPSPEVRGSALQALVALGDARALPALFPAAKRGMPGSWEAIGQLATPADFKRLLGQAVSGDVTPLRPALDVLVARPNLSPDAKLKLVQELGKLASFSAHAYLNDWLSGMKSDAPARVRSALVDTLRKLDRAAPAPASDKAAPASASGSAAARPAAKSDQVAANIPEVRR
jgi:hypothetical protein